MNDKTKRYVLVLFLIFLLVSAAVRVIYPSADAPFDISWSQGPSTDPSYYLSADVDLLKGRAFTSISRSWNAPAYYLLYLPTLLIFGVGFAQANIMTVILSLVAFVFFFLILKRTEDNKTLIFACLFWALTYLWAMFNRIPIIYTVMIMYMLIALWFWLKGLDRPIYFIGAWIILLIAILYVKVIAVALVPAFLVGHLAIYLSQEKNKESTIKKGIVILLGAGITILIIIMLGRFFDLSPIDSAAGRIKTHIREDIFGDNLLLYLFNFGASGSFIEKNPVTAFLAYCYFIIFIKDLFLKRISVSNRKDLIMMIFLAWAVFGSIATIFFKYAPPRFFLFLYPPLFVLAAAALARILLPGQKEDLGYGFYLVLPFWLILLVFRFLLMALLYVAENYETFVIGLRLSFESAEKILSILNFASSFYFLLTVSLIISIIITTATFVFNRGTPNDARKPIVRRELRIIGAGVIILIFLVGQTTLFWGWFTKPRYTLVETSREIGTMLEADAKLTGPYAHPLTMENDLKRTYMYMWDPDKTPPCIRFKKSGITHLVIDTTNGLGYIERYYPDTFDCLILIDTFYVRGNPINLYLFTGAEGYIMSDYERAVFFMQSENWAAAADLLSNVIKKHPDSSEAYVTLARCRIKLGDITGSEEALTKALALNPDNMVANWGIGQILESNGDINGALMYYREASHLFPDSKNIKKRLAELQNSGK